MISLAARDRKLTERLLLALRRQTVIGHALSVRAIAPFHPHFARQRHPAQVDGHCPRRCCRSGCCRRWRGRQTAPVCRDGSASSGSSSPRALKLARTIAPWVGTTLTTASSRSTLSAGVGIQRDPVFTILSGIRQDGIPAPVGAYPGLVFHFHAAGAGAFTSTTVSFNGWLRVMPLACASTPPLTP